MSDCCSCWYSWLKWGAVFAILIAIYAKFFRKRVFGYLLNDFAEGLKGFLEPGKREIFEKAFEKVKRLSSTKGNNLKVVEIGIGTGTNFKFYPENTDIIVSDKSDAFLPYLRETLKKMNREDLKIHDFVCYNAEHMEGIESNSMDAVVATFTLCSVDNLHAVFNEIHRVLKPGGVFIFMDHSKNTKNLFMNALQTVIEPLWSFVLDNCRFRDIRSEFARYSKFETLEINEYKKCEKGVLLRMINPIFYGHGQKAVKC